MNYHKKLQPIGFKKCAPLVVCDYDSYKEAIDGKKIITLSDFIEKEKLKYKNKPTFITVRYFSIGGTEDQLSKLKTYYWKISDSFTIFISIYQHNFACFGYDSDIEDRPNKYSNRVIENDKTFIIDTDILNDHFWKNILANLDTQHRREVLLKEII